MKPLKPFAAIVALAIAALVWTSTPAFADAAQATPPFKWWQSDKYIKELVLLPDQSRRIEDVFQKAMPKLKEKNSVLAEAEAKFEKLIERGDDALIMEQVNVMEAARAELNKSRTLMLLDMRRVLTPGQWAKFKAMHPAALTGATPSSPAKPK